jgi:hypothetical protein
LGQAFVLAKIQLAVSDSFLHFSFHDSNALQFSGECGSSPHLIQKEVEQESQLAVMTSESLKSPEVELSAATRSHPGPGHQREVPFNSTKFLNWYILYFSNKSGLTCRTSSSVTTSLHPT